MVLNLLTIQSFKSFLVLTRLRFSRYVTSAIYTTYFWSGTVRMWHTTLKGSTTGTLLKLQLYIVKHEINLKDM